MRRSHPTHDWWCSEINNLSKIETLHTDLLYFDKLCFVNRLQSIVVAVH